ncbi:MAG: Ig-like domain repeat protein [Terriglobales bacterium]
MKRAYLICLFQCLTTTFLFSQSNSVSLINQSARVASPISASQADPKAQARILDSYGKLPLSFEANHGQTDGRVKFLSRTSGYSLFLTGDEAVLALRGKKSSPQGVKPSSLAARSGTLRLRSGQALEAVPFPKTVHGTSSNKNDAAADRTTGGVLRMKLRNANSAAKVTGLDELAGTSNYFIGNDPAKWRTNVPTYAKVKYEGIYSGIDLVYYGNQRQLEYDFIVAPGADPRRIEFGVLGAKRIRRDERGDLVLRMEMGEGEIRWHKPLVYQEKNGTRQEIAAHYAITEKNRVRFEVARYDATKPLYIDPLIYSTYLGGSNTDEGYSIAVDSAGNAYVIGTTCSSNFPTANAWQPSYGGSCHFDWWERYFGGDAFVTKINASGSALVYSTYLGGSGDDMGNGIAVDSAGNAYVVGTTCSTDFPTMNALQPVYAGGSCDYMNGHRGGDAFVAKINASGSALVYSTYFGGSGDDFGGSDSEDEVGHGNGIAVDSSGNAYFTGHTASTDFPTTPGSFQTTYGGGVDAFVTKLNPTGAALIYSSYLGGSSGDGGSGIALDSTGNAYVTGQTTSTDFPTSNPLQPTFGGGVDAFVSKVDPTGSSLVYSTYLGGSWVDRGYGIAVDSSENAYVTGYTTTNDFPTTPGAYNTVCGPEVFVTKIDSSGALAYSTCLGGGIGQGMAVDSKGNAYATGYTTSTGFPTTPGAFQTTCGGGKYCGFYPDAFVTKLNPTGSALIYSTYLGGKPADEGRGIAVDSAGNAYVTGFTYGAFPITPGAFQTIFGGAYSDAFVTELDVRAVPVITLTSSLNPSTYGQAVTFNAVLTSTIGAPPDGETVTFMNGTRALGTGTLSGGSASFATSKLTGGTDKIKAVYGGDANFGPSTSKALKQVVNKATTTTTLTSSLNPSNYGQSVTFTASVAPQFGGTVKGTVTFYDGTTALKTVPLSGGAAKFTTSTLASGTHSITATYNGSTSFDGSTSAPVNQVVRVATTTTLSSSPNPSTYGQAVTFTATVTSTLGTPPPDGETISFMKGTTVLGTGTLSGGSASFTTSTLPVGTNAIKAVYGGDSNFPGSTSKAVSQVVDKATTTTTLTSSLNPSNFRQSVTFTASVTPQFSGTVKGTVTFYDGTTALKTASLSGGVAKFTTKTLASGVHTITATYNGNASFSGSSASLTQTVN